MNEFVRKTEKIGGYKNYILIDPIPMTPIKKIISVRSDNKIGVETKSPEGAKIGFISLNAAMMLAPEISQIAGCII